jgi:hypothetical protein
MLFTTWLAALTVEVRRHWRAPAGPISAGSLAKTPEKPNFLLDHPPVCVNRLPTKFRLLKGTETLVRSGFSDIFLNDPLKTRVRREGAAIPKKVRNLKLDRPARSADIAPASISVRRDL